MMDGTRRCHHTPGLAMESCDTYRLSPSKLLLVAVDPASHGDWRDHLQPSDWTVFEAADIRSAIELAIRHQPHLIITEMQLPDASGYSFLRTLRTAVDNDVKIVGIANTPDAAEQGRTAGFDLIIDAPVDFDALEDLVARADVDPAEKKPTRRIRRIDS